MPGGRERGQGSVLERQQNSAIASAAEDFQTMSVRGVS